MASLQVVLLGNPNAGKTVLFNALTAQHRRVGNFPGVTVDLSYGLCQLSEHQMAQVIDLPGCYSCLQSHAQGPEDQQLACRSIHHLQADVWVNVVDACHLERHLYLTMQLLESGRPLVVVLNRMDLAAQQGLRIDVAALREALGVPVIPASLVHHEGLEEIRRTLSVLPASSMPMTHHLPMEMTPPPDMLDELGWEAWEYWRALEGDLDQINQLTPAQARVLDEMREAIHCRLGEDVEVAIAAARYRQVHHVTQRVLSGQHQVSRRWAKVDEWLMHPIIGLVAFFGLMYLVFWATIGWGGVLQEGIAALGELWLVAGVSSWVGAWGGGPWLQALVGEGIGVGLTTTLTFIPLIAILFMFLTALEDSGYMARAVFLLDRCLSLLGLPGRSFVAMIIGLGCNVPAVMAARTCANRRERVLTALMAPFMSCGARLTLYTVLIGAFFPRGGQNVVFALYVLGIVMAVFTGWVLRHTLLPGDLNPLVMELPLYQCPQWSHVWRQGMRQAGSFFKRGCRWVVPMTVVISALTHWPWHQHGQSVLDALHRMGSTLFLPMGLGPDNWPAMVGLLTGVVAKEVVVSTLNSLYIAKHVALHFPGWHAAGVQSLDIVRHGVGQALAFWELETWKQGQLQAVAYRQMVQRFVDAPAAFSYCVFVLLYMPCVSTLAAIDRELKRGWAWFSLAWSMTLAYVAAVWAYQWAHITDATVYRLGLLGGSAALIGLWFLGLKAWVRRREGGS